MKGRGGAPIEVEPKRVPIGHVASTTRPGETVCGMPMEPMPRGHYCAVRPAPDEACLTCVDLLARKLAA